MKRTANMVLSLAVSFVLLHISSCGDFLYQPKRFVRPTLSIPLVSRDSIRSFLGVSSNNFKLAFTHASYKSLYIVDFSRMETDTGGNEHPVVITLTKDPKRSGHQFDSPLLSPDGELVTYYLRSGVTGQAPYVQQVGNQTVAVEVAARGTDPHFWQDSTGALYMVYSDNSLVQVNTLSSITGFATYRQKINRATGALIGARSNLTDKPFNGGLSSNGRYLCTGYADGVIADLDDAGKLYGVNSGKQICNPSITPDTLAQDRMLFLPFSGAQNLSYIPGLTPLGSIGMHEYLIVSDKSNTVQWYIRHPADYAEWQDPEWTNHENFVIALAKITDDDDDVRHDCFLVRRSDNAMLKLTTENFKMDNTATPSFWISQQE